MKKQIIVPNVDEKIIKSLADATSRKNIFLTEEGVSVVLALNINNDNQ